MQVELALEITPRPITTQVAAAEQVKQVGITMHQPVMDKEDQDPM